MNPILKELQDVIVAVKNALADGKLTWGEILIIAKEAADLVAALLQPNAPKKPGGPAVP